MTICYVKQGTRSSAISSRMALCSQWNLTVRCKPTAPWWPPAYMAGHIVEGKGLLYTYGKVVDKSMNFEPTKAHLNVLFFLCPTSPPHESLINNVTTFFSSTVLVTFRQHFIKCCNILGTNMVIINILLAFFKHFSEMFQHFQKCSNIFQKCWFHQLFVEHFAKMLQYFFRNDGTFF
jgi:hypothetical protein